MTGRRRLKEGDSASTALTPVKRARSRRRTQRRRKVDLRRTHARRPCCRGSVFVNADEIAKQRWPNDPAAHAYDAALVAAETRGQAHRAGPHHSSPRRCSPTPQAGNDRYRRRTATPSSCMCCSSRKTSRWSASNTGSAPAGTTCRSTRSANGTADCGRLVARAMHDGGQGNRLREYRRKGPRIVAQISDGFLVGCPSWPHWTPWASRDHWPD